MKEHPNKGNPKVPGSGRQKGTRNAKTLAREAGLKPLVKELKKHKFDVVSELISIYREAGTVNEEDLLESLKFKHDVLKSILDRISPKLAPLKVEAVAADNEGDSNEIVLEASDQQLLEAMKNVSKTD